MMSLIQMYDAHLIPKKVIPCFSYIDNIMTVSLHCFMGDLYVYQK